eukprot:TRINITY_DN25582_c0_g1_i1.p1 TRINITY_DN25582_c0_g1~~TRINITY_DN25582_c0_g1_i1.p1  ORF type:complete len:355 (-),score=58.82 TRINITY_DN25582_c0_g1_i1:81-1145(-)
MAPNTDFSLAQYVWIDADGGYRCKSRVFQSAQPPALEKLPSWNYDGSSTGQAPGEDSEVIIVPRAVYHDPFRGGDNIIVLTDAYDPQGNPIPTNTRAPAADIFAQKTELEPWYGIEQEYTLFKDGTPLGWPSSTARSFGGPTTQLGFPGAQGPYYCSAGADVAFGRPLVEKHLKFGLYAGINISGINAEVMPGQWEYQVGGPGSVGIACADDLTVSRFLLNRVGEEFGITVSFDPKPIPGDWNGAGCHTNFSTKPMREEDNAVETIFKPMMEKLGAAHKEHIAAYGIGNEKRLTGRHETASIDTFKYGVADRGASIRIGNQTAQDGKGYFEDRRPASNMDPYVVTSMIFKTCCL